MAETHNTDMLGREPKVGDRIAAAFDRKGLPELRVGKIVDIWNTQASVQWDAASPGSAIKGKTTNFSLGLQRYIVLSGVDFE